MTLVNKGKATPSFFVVGLLELSQWAKN